MIDSTKIDALIVAARARDKALGDELLGEVARLSAHNHPWPQQQPAHLSSSGLEFGAARPVAENGSYAMQLYSAICFAIDARAELKLLELIASPTFYDAIMRSAAEKKD